ncbi:MAG: hypothetical protein JXR19_09090 [Bacteroidia bacterium]
MAKINWQLYLRKTLYVVAIGLLIFLLVSLRAKHLKQVCTDIDINISVPSDRQMINRAMIEDKLMQWYSGGLIGVPSANIDLADIEKQLLAMDVVAKAEVSFQLGGELQIDIDQRIPILRIYSNENESYFLDYTGAKISWGEYNSPRVIIASGHLSESMIKKVYTLARYVQENPFAEAITEQIFVTDGGDLILIPKLSSQQVIFGDATELEDKFYRLEQFYKHGMKRVGWDKYKTINLKFANQIVCS